MHRTSLFLQEFAYLGFPLIFLFVFKFLELLGFLIHTQRSINKQEGLCPWEQNLLANRFHLRVRRGLPKGAHTKMQRI